MATRRTPPPSPDAWQRARDLVAAGFPLREVARRINVIPQTLMKRAKTEGWYRPDKEREKAPPPPRPPTRKAPPPKYLGVGDPPPAPASFEDDIAYTRALLRWATEGIATLARTIPNMQALLLEKLPNVLKALIACEAERRPAEAGGDLLKQFEDRLAKIQRPPSRPCDIGESPRDQTEGGE